MDKYKKILLLTIITIIMTSLIKVEAKANPIIPTAKSANYKETCKSTNSGRNPDTEYNLDYDIKSEGGVF